MSALHPKADIVQQGRYVRFGPCVDGSELARRIFTSQAWSVQPVIRYAKIHGTRHRPWLTALLARRPTKVAAIALANKIARMG
ncbi:MAG: hypothetical protein ACLQF4_13575 [Xanthobacteraceae bacterium]